MCIIYEADNRMFYFHLCVMDVRYFNVTEQHNGIGRY